MSLPALEDIAAHRGTTDPIDDVVRIETAPREKATPIIMEMMRSVYPHDEVFGEFCTVNSYIDCPPDELFDYLADTRFEEGRIAWQDHATEEPGLWVSHRLIGFGDKDLHPHGGQPGGHDRGLSLRVGPGQAPLDDLPDAGRGRAVGV